LYGRRFRSDHRFLTTAPRKVVTTYWVGAGESTKIGREWSETSCERDYSIVEAEYR
jgi:hypothetical protein